MKLANINANVAKTFLLLNSSFSSKQLLCFVLGQGQKKIEQKHTTKSFVEFHNHFSLLTMLKKFKTCLP